MGRYQEKLGGWGRAMCKGCYRGMYGVADVDAGAAVNPNPNPDDYYPTGPGPTVASEAGIVPEMEEELSLPRSSLSSSTSPLSASSGITPRHFLDTS